MKKNIIIFIFGFVFYLFGQSQHLYQAKKKQLPYTIVDTGQIRCYNNYTEISYPKTNGEFFGQDANYNGNQPAYKNNNDGTVTDLNTGLMWTRDPGAKKTYEQAVSDAKKCRVGGYGDWRLPTIKELYSLILFNGTDPDPRSINSSGLQPYIDTTFFKFQYGKASEGDRIIDSQYATSTLYGSTTMRGNKTVFGVNFADGRIKGYGIVTPRGKKKFYVMYVRGNQNYGKNNFKDNGDGTITDRATDLMWMKIDSGKLKAGKMNWQQALDWAENLEYAGYSDWRLPNAKELHSIVDYSRCPDITQSAAIDPIFEVTSITNEKGKPDYPYYWSSTTHAKLYNGLAGVYISFGRALGFMRGIWLDVHGAGAQRCDMKSGNPSQLPKGRGPQGDAMRIYNYVRCVRGGAAEICKTGPKVQMTQKHPSYSKAKQQHLLQNHRKGASNTNSSFFHRLDKDGDGKISREEFDGPNKHFNYLDKDSDGFIEKEEAPLKPPTELR